MFLNGSKSIQREPFFLEERKGINIGAKFMKKLEWWHPLHKGDISLFNDRKY